MTEEVRAPTRSGEWRCLCPANIRAASCSTCTRCGMRRPMTSGETLLATQAAITALDIYKRGVRAHGNEAAAMSDVLAWIEGGERE